MTAPALARPLAADSAAVVRPRTRPVVVWAVVGGLQIVLAVYCVIRWISSGQAHATDPGPDTMSGAEKAAMWALEVIGPTVAVWCIWQFLVRPWVRERRVTSDGMLLVGCFFMAIPHDILLTYSSPSFSYNSHYLNKGSWLGQVPGVLTPNAHKVPEPLVLVVPAYGWCVFLAAVLGCALMRKVAARWSVRTTALLAITFAFWFVIDIAFESALVWLHVQAYTGTVSGLPVLWRGTDHQLPLYESVFWALFWTGITAVRYYRDDKGLTFAERGTSDLKISTGRQTMTRQLALIGVGAAVITVLYNVPWALTSVHNDQFPKHLPSYLLNGVCAMTPDQITPALPACPGVSR